MVFSQSFIMLLPVDFAPGLVEKCKCFDIAPREGLFTKRKLYESISRVAVILVNAGVL